MSVCRTSLHRSSCQEKSLCSFIDAWRNYTKRKAFRTWVYCVDEANSTLELTSAANLHWASKHLGKAFQRWSLHRRLYTTLRVASTRRKCYLASRVWKWWQDSHLRSAVHTAADQRAIDHFVARLIKEALQQWKLYAARAKYER